MKMVMVHLQMDSSKSRQEAEVVLTVVSLTSIQQDNN